MHGSDRAETMKECGLCFLNTVERLNGGLLFFFSIRCALLFMFRSSFLSSSPFVFLFLWWSHVFICSEFADWVFHEISAFILGGVYICTNVRECSFTIGGTGSRKNPECIYSHCMVWSSNTKSLVNGSPPQIIVRSMELENLNILESNIYSIYFDNVVRS